MRWLNCAVIRERNTHLRQVRLKCGQPQCLLALHKEAQRTKGRNILSGYALLQENVKQIREVKLQGLTERAGAFSNKGHTCFFPSSLCLPGASESSGFKASHRLHILTSCFESGSFNGYQLICLSVCGAGIEFPALCNIGQCSTTEPHLILITFYLFTYLCIYRQCLTYPKLASTLI